MIRTALWLFAVTLKNGALRQFARLRQPRYVISVAIGIAYFAFLVGRSAANRITAHGRPIAGMEEIVLPIAVLVIGLLMLLVWAHPDSSGAMELTQAEVGFLFTAPVPRRGLLFFELVKSQRGLIVTALVLALFAFRGTNPLRLWLIFTLLSFYFLFVRSARARLRMAGIGFPARLVIVAVILTALAAWGVRQFDEAILTAAAELLSTNRLAEALELLGSRLSSPAVTVLLFVPRLVAQPLVAGGLALAVSVVASAALALLFLQLASAIEYPYEEATDARSRKVASRRELAGSRGAADSRVALRGAWTSLPLGDRGLPDVAITWKNSIAGLRVYSSRALVVLIPLALVVIGVLVARPGARVTMQATSAILLITAGFVLLVAPQMFRNDIRSDFSRLELLRSFPLPGWRIVAASVAAPLAFIVVLQVAVTIPAGALLIGTGAPPVLVLYLVVLGPLFVAPLAALQLLIHNALLIMLPAWHITGDQRGLAATGQRILLFLAQMITLAIALLPAGFLFAMVYFSASFLGVGAPNVWVASTAAAASLVVWECYGIVRLLGRELDQLDVSGDLAGSEA
jgi:ABC-2 type transport system permease protein